MGNVAFIAEKTANQMSGTNDLGVLFIENEEGTLFVEGDSGKVDSRCPMHTKDISDVNPANMVIFRTFNSKIGSNLKTN